jgi:DNA repair exonuclease SbcCD nuclease subunit
VVAERRLAAIDRVLAIAREQRVDFVLACGDLFEDNRVSGDLLSDTARRLASFPDVSIHAIPGNHDLPGPDSVWNRAALRSVPNLRVHLEPRPWTTLDGAVTLHPFPVKSRYANQDPLAALGDLRDLRGIHVALAHGHLTTVTFGGHEDDVRLPIDPAHVDRVGLDYLALGHWHGTRLEKGRDGRVRVAYPGTHETTAFEEQDSGNVLVVTIAEKGAAPLVETLRSGSLRWTTERFRFAGDRGVDRLARVLDALDADLVRLDVEGELAAALFADYQALLERARSRLVHLRVRDEALAWRAEPSLERRLGDASLAEVERRLLEIAASASESEAAVAREALALLSRFAAETAS